VVADAGALKVLKERGGQEVSALEDGGHWVPCVDTHSIAHSGTSYHGDGHFENCHSSSSSQSHSVSSSSP